MAKKAEGKPNKSQAIRDYVAANPSATNPEVAAALAKKGVEVTANVVSIVKSNAKKKRGGKKPAPVSSGVADQLKAATNLIGVAGSVDSAIEVLRALKGIVK